MRFLFVFVLALVFAAPAAAKTSYTVDPRMSAAASILANQKVEVRCMELGDKDDYGQDLFDQAPGLYGYVYITDPESPVEYLSVAACAGVKMILDKNYSDGWKMALGALVFVHESLHLDVKYEFTSRKNESTTECRALQKLRYGVYLLSHDPKFAAWLYPSIAQIDHMLGSEYHQEPCNIPSNP